ncbi:MAG TPA: hypothetical protein PKK11_01265 [Methanothrix sp.]|nr:hypothetical protein [Methanothrix sp.]
MPGSSRNRVRNVFEPIEPLRVAKLWQERFGMGIEAFSGLQFFKKANSIWAISEGDLPRYSYESLGMRIMSCKDRPWKPTTAALQVLGRHASKNLVHLERAEALLFLQGASQSLPEYCNPDACQPGYVVVFYRGDALGCGLYSHGMLVSQIPKERRMESRSEEQL